jgi:hypothetical protein
LPQYVGKRKIQGWLCQQRGDLLTSLSTVELRQ